MAVRTLRRIIGLLLRFLAVLVLLVGALLFYNRTYLAHPEMMLGKLIQVRNNLIQNGPVTYWWGDLVRTIEVVGNTAYVGLGTRMGVYDVTDPHHPRMLEALSLRGIVHGYTVRGNVLYCAHGASGMSAFDITDPDNPVRLGQLTFPGYGMHVAPLQNDFLLFSNEAGGWYVLDVKDPSNMFPIAHVSGGWVSAARVYGNVAYILDGYQGMVIYDVSSPKHPVELKTVPIQLPKKDFVIDPPPIWMELQDGYAYVSNGSDGMRVIDVRDPKEARVVAHLPLESYSYTVAVRGNRAYMANLSLGLVVIDISNPLEPRVLRNVPTPGNAFDILLRDNHGYVSDGANGFMIMDFADADVPREVGYAHVEARTRGVALAGDTLVTADTGHGVRIFDVKARQAPVLLGSVDTPGLARQVTIAGNTIYSVDVLGGFQEIDASHPDQPRLKRNFALEEHPWGIFRNGDYLYCAMGSHGFSVYDSRKEPPENLFSTYFRAPVQIRESQDSGGPSPSNSSEEPARVPGDGYMVASGAADGLAYSGDLMQGLSVYDVSDSRAIKQVGRYSIDPFTPRQLYNRGGVTTVLGIYAEGKRAYLAGYERGLEIINVTDPAKPVREGHYPAPGHSYGVWKDGTQVCLVTYEGDLFVIDVTDTTAPRLKKRLSLPGELQDVVCEKNIAYVAAGTEGLVTVNIETGEHASIPIR